MRTPREFAPMCLISMELADRRFYVRGAQYTPNPNKPFTITSLRNTHPQRPQNHILTRKCPGEGGTRTSPFVDPVLTKRYRLQSNGTRIGKVGVSKVSDKIRTSLRVPHFFAGLAYLALCWLFLDVSARHPAPKSEFGIRLALARAAQLRKAADSPLTCSFPLSSASANLVAVRFKEPYRQTFFRFQRRPLDRTRTGRRQRDLPFRAHRRLPDRSLFVGIQNKNRADCGYAELLLLQRLHVFAAGIGRGNASAPPTTTTMTPKLQSEIDKAAEKMRKQQFDEAQKHFEKAAKMAPGNPDVQYMWGMLDYYQQHYDQARTKLETAISINPNHERALVSLGEIQLRAKAARASGANSRKSVSRQRRRLAHALSARICVCR